MIKKLKNWFFRKGRQQIFDVLCIKCGEKLKPYDGPDCLHEKNRDKEGNQLMCNIKNCPVVREAK